VKPRLKVWAESRGQTVRLLVQDNGIGIPADQHEKIFGIFQRANRDFDGTGIGLAIVKKAAARIGGNVGLQSEPGRGSTFWVDVRKG
jgi:signal transduction histidine kinase